MQDPYEFPCALPPEGKGGNALGWTAAILVQATLALALLNAETIDHWAAQLPRNRVTAVVVEGAGRWHDFTNATGLSFPRAAAHREWKEMQAASWLDVGIGGPEPGNQLAGTDQDGADSTSRLSATSPPALASAR